MNKKLLAAAVASAFAAPAFAQFAQTSDVILYGRLNLGIDNAWATGSYLNTATVNHDWKDRSRVFDTGSRLGVRGSEDLGNGLRAIFQIESGLNANNGSSVSEANQYNPSAGTLASRPSWVGLEGNWGRVQFGRQDVYWSNGTINQTGSNYVNVDIPWLTSGGNGRVTSGVSRQSNVAAYTTPTIAGFNATLSWSPDSNSAGNLNGSSAENAGQGKNTNARLWGATVRWAQGPFQAQYDFAYKQQASDFTAIAAGSGFPVMNAQPKWWSNKLGVAWMYVPGGQVSLIGTHIDNQDVAINEVDTAGPAPTATPFQNLRQDTLTLTWEHLLGGNILVMGQVGHEFDVHGCDGSAVTVNGFASTVADQVCHHSGANAYMAGLRYNMSKRTGVYFTVNGTTNQQNQFADYTSSAYSVGSSANCQGNPCTPGTVGNPFSNGIGSTGKGAHVTIIGVGLMHNF